MSWPVLYGTPTAMTVNMVAIRPLMPHLGFYVEVMLALYQSSCLGRQRNTQTRPSIL